MEGQGSRLLHIEKETGVGSSNIEENKKNRKSNKPKNIRCIYTNADSLLNKRNELLVVIEELKPDVIGITEVKPKHCRFTLQEDELKIPQFRCFSKTEDSGRGVLIYVREHLKPSQEDKLNSMYEDAVWCSVVLPDKDSVLLGCVYRSPNNSDIDNARVNIMLKAASDMKHKHHILMGDFNFPEIDWDLGITRTSENHPAYLFLECTRDGFYTQHMTEPTHYRGNQRANMLDLIFTNEDNTISDIKVHPPLGNSHHCVLEFATNLKGMSDIIEREVYMYEKGDYDGFNNYMREVDWEAKLNGKTVEEMWDEISGKITDGMKKYIPTYHIRMDKPGKPLWMNEVTLRKVRKKHSAWRRYVTTKEGRDYQEYCKYRNQAKWETRKAVKNFERSIAEESKKNPKACFKYFKSKTKTDTRIPNLEYEGKTYEKDDEKAEIMNNYFCSVFTNEDTTHIPTFEKKQVTIEHELPIIDNETVLKKLRNLKKHKSPGPDCIHPRILIEISANISVPLTTLFNKSMEEGIVPNKWKEACVTPLFKKGNRNLPSNYRPISLTSIICKILESIIRDSIVKFMDNNKLWYTDQHGFLRGKSCITQLLQVIEDWSFMLNERKCVTNIYLDFAKAFDSVPHRRLLHKLEGYGIHGAMVKWIESFLVNRKQRVKINGVQSCTHPVVSGVPQGSVLGPVLFLTYINDMPDNIESTLKMFADDTKIYLQTNTEEQCRSLQEDLGKLTKWSETWQLRFNTDKCKTMTLGNVSIEYVYNMDDGNGKIAELSTTSVEKDLGIFIDNKLNFKHHICSAVTKANQICEIIRRTFTYLDEFVFKKLFTSLVRPHLEYGNAVWAPHLKQNINTIENVQRRATKLIPGFNKLAYSERLERLKLPTLIYRCWRGNMIEVYKFMNQIYEVELESVGLQRDNESITRGHKFKLYKQKYNLALRKNAFGLRVVNEWNKLPEEIVESESVNVFKNRLDKFWKDRMYNIDYKWNQTHV